MLIHIWHNLLDPRLWQMLAWMLPAIVAMFLMHEGGHAVLGAAAGSPINAFGLGPLTLGRTWLWSPDEPWNPRGGKWQKRRFGWNPHVITHPPYPSTGWVRLMKSGGGPLGSLLGVFIVLDLSGTTLLHAWQTSNLFALMFWVMMHTFQFAFLLLSLFGFLNIVPRRPVTRFYRWAFGMMGFGDKPSVRRWLFRRDRLVNDGDRFFSAITRHRRGRRWHRGGPRKSYSVPTP